MKNKWIILGSIAVVVVLLGAGVMFLLGGGETNNNSSIGNENVVEMTPEDIGLTLEPINNNQEIKMTISKLDEIESIEGTFSYEADEGGERVSRGALVTVEADEIEGESVIEREVTLGTCSSGTCKYDKGVTEINIELRINLKSGEVGLVTESLTL